MEIEYIAGLFDGEGWITLGRNNRDKDYFLHIGLGSTYKPILWKLAHSLGGKVYRTNCSKNKPFFIWYVRSADAENFLKRLYPYLIIKKEEAKAALYYLNNNISLRGIKNKKIKMRIRVMRKKIFLKLKQLKKLNFG